MEKVRLWCGERSDRGQLKEQKGALKMREWKKQELKHIKSRPYRNFWRSKLESGCVWLSTVDSRQLVASPTELTGLVPRVGVMHFDVEADSDSGAQKLRVFILLLYSSYCFWVLHSRIEQFMSHVYLFSHVYVILHLLNYNTGLCWKLTDNYKQSTNMQKGRNESNELSSSNLIFFRNNLGLVFHTTYSCIFHACIFHSCFFHSCIFHPCRIDWGLIDQSILNQSSINQSLKVFSEYSASTPLLLFPLLHFPPLQFWPYRIFYIRIFSRPE